MISQRIGQIQRPGKKPENVTIIDNTIAVLTDAEQAAGIAWVNGDYPPGDVRRYGAVGDGVADDKAAIVAAESSLTSGGTLYFPSGTYLVGSAIVLTNSNVTWRGDGAKSIIKSSATGYHLFAATALTDLTFDGLRFEGAETSANAIDCFDFNPGCDRITIRDCIFSGPNATTGFNVAIDCQTSDYLKVDGCYFERLIGTTSGNGYGVIIHTDCDHAKITNNTFEMAISGSASGRHAIYFSAGTTNSIASGNSINNCANESMVMYSLFTQNTQTGNLFVNNFISNGTHRGIGVTENVRGAIITGNHISNITTNSGIVVEGNANAQPSYCIISDNYIENIDQYGILMLAGRDSLIRANVVKAFSQQTADTYVGILLTEAASSGGDNNQCFDNYVIQETVQARSGIQTDASVTGIVLRGNTVTGTYLIDQIEDDAADTILSDNDATVT